MAAHNRAAFEQAILPHLDSAYNLARWLVRDPSLADDVVQDAVVRALGYFASFRGGDGRSWLMHIVRNAALDALAKRGRIIPVPDFVEDEPDPSDDPEAALARCQNQRVLAQALEALPIELRECLVLRELEDMSYKEIAAITGVPAGTVMSRLWRARQQLLGAALPRVAS